MSLITSCPACATMFRVVPDQLKISEGWVRCGHCGEVFDAAAHLADAGSAASSEPAAAGVPSPPAGASSPSDAAGRGRETPPAPPPASVPLPLTPPKADTAAPIPVRSSRPPSPPPASSFGPDSELEPSSLDAPFVFRRSDLVDDGALPSVLPPAPQDSRLPDEDDFAGQDGDDLDSEQPSFVRQARRKALWRRPGMRLALTLASLVLAAGLVLQLAHHDRNRLAVAQPELRPALALMCGYLGCTLGHPRQIEAIVIDSSGFNRLRGENYRLSFNVRNTAPNRVAAPALELTLTDAQDQPLMRRVLLPQELGLADGVINAGSDWAGSAGVVVAPSGAGRVAGYRLLAFYP